MSNKFVSWLEAIGRGAEHDLEKILPWLATSGEVAVSVFAPALGPLFNQTVTAVAMAEQNFAAIGKQSGTGASKAAAVLGVMGNLIKQGLADAGKASDDAAVQKYIDSVVAVLNAAPAPAPPPKP